MVDAWNPNNNKRQIFELKCEKTGEVFETVKKFDIAFKRAKYLSYQKKTKVHINPIMENAR